MINFIRSAFGNEFLRKAANLSVFMAVGQGLALLNWSLITYVVSQSDVGEYFVLLSIVPPLALVSLLSYEFAIPNVPSGELVNLVFAIIAVLTGTCVLIVAVGMAIEYRFTVPLMMIVLGRGCGAIGEMLCTRQERIRLMSGMKIIQPALFTVLLIAFLFRGGTTLTTLVHGTAVLQSVVALVYFVLSLQKVAWKRVGVEDVLDQIKQHGKNPLLLMPSNLMNSLAFNLPVIVMGQYFGPIVAANYGLVLRCCFTPVTTIGGGNFSCFP